MTEFWTEGSFIFKDLYGFTGWNNLRGFRFVFQPRFYTGKANQFFIAPEFRLKHMAYGDTRYFINDVLADTLTDFYHQARQWQVGGAIVFGRRFRISRSGLLFAETTSGIGAKQRLIRRKGIPAGYYYKPEYRGFALAPHYNFDNEGAAYFPLAFRLIWKLNSKGKKGN